MLLKNSLLRVLVLSIFTFSALFSSPIASASEKGKRSYDSSCKSKYDEQDYRTSLSPLSERGSKSKSSRDENKRGDKKCKNYDDDEYYNDDEEEVEEPKEVYEKVPSAVSNLLIATCSENVSLTWSAPTKPRSIPISSYSIRYSTDSGLTWTSHPVTTTQTTISLSALTPGLTYIFQVAAQNISGLGVWSSSSLTCTVNNQTPITYTYSISGLQNIVDGAILEYSPDGITTVPTALVLASGPQSGTFSKGLLTYDLYLSLLPGVAYTFIINGVSSSPAAYFQNYATMNSSQGVHPIARPNETDFFYTQAQFYAFQLTSGTAINIEIITPGVIIP